MRTAVYSHTTMYVIGDLHLDHASIIDYCDRPFETVKEMNTTLIENWNSTVGPDDDLLFLGDLTVKSGVAAVYNRVEELNGTWTFIYGNHDTVAPPNIPEPAVCHHYQFTYHGIPFYAVHDPAEMPQNFRGWVLHGHHHNNHLDQFPFVHPSERRVNVSVELVNYRPLHIDDLIPHLQRMTHTETLPDTDRVVESD